MGEFRKGDEVDALKHRIARQLHHHCCWLEPIKGFGNGRAVAFGKQFSACKHHLGQLQHIHVGESHLQGGSAWMQRLHQLESAMQGGHAGGMQADGARCAAINPRQPFADRLAGPVAGFCRWR